MESMRDINRVMEREVAKGSCPLAFERMEFGSKPFQFIISEEKLNEVLTYLLRIRTFGQYAGKSIINNVYMDLDMLCNVFIKSWNHRRYGFPLMRFTKHIF